MSQTTDISHNTDDLDKLLEEKHKLERKKWYHFRIFNDLSNRISELDKKIMETCHHNWVIDRSSYEPCGPTPQICTKCGLGW